MCEYKRSTQRNIAGIHFFKVLFLGLQSLLKDVSGCLGPLCSPSSFCVQKSPFRGHDITIHNVIFLCLICFFYNTHQIHNATYSSFQGLYISLCKHSHNGTAAMTVKCLKSWFSADCASGTRMCHSLQLYDTIPSSLLEKKQETTHEGSRRYFVYLHFLNNWGRTQDI